MMKKLAILILALSPMSVIGEDAFPEPFGLSWDMPEASLKAIGFTNSGETDGLNMLTSVSVPKAWSKADMYVAVTYKGLLVKVGAVSTNFTDDIYGTDGKKTYNQLKELLTKKYGSPSSQYERIGGETIYDDADEFYQCLEYTGCGAYQSIFEFAGGHVFIQLKGKRRGEGYLTIMYESPGFSAAKEKIGQHDLESDSDAF